jgi:hypothetical protein
MLAVQDVIMLAYRIVVNGEQRLLVGFDDWDTLNVTLLAIREGTNGALEFQFHVGGGVRCCEEGKLEHVRWKAPEVTLGDTVSIAIVEVDEADLPARHYRSDKTVQENPFTADEIEQFEKQDYERLRKKFEGNG